MVHGQDLNAAASAALHAHLYSRLGAASCNHALRHPDQASRWPHAVLGAQYWLAASSMSCSVERRPYGARHRECLRAPPRGSRDTAGPPHATAMAPASKVVLAVTARLSWIARPMSAVSGARRLP